MAQVSREAATIVATDADHDADELIDRHLDRRIKLISESYSHAATYDNVIMVGGYAAFFGLWAGVAGDVSAATRTASAAIMGVSLVFYISWHLLSMLTRNSFDSKIAALLASATKPEDVVEIEEEWDEIEKRKKRAAFGILRWWPWVFRPAVASGMIAALLLIYGAAAVAIGLPEL